MSDKFRSDNYDLVGVEANMISVFEQMHPDKAPDEILHMANTALQTAIRNLAE